MPCFSFAALLEGVFGELHHFGLDSVLLLIGELHPFLAGKFISYFLDSINTPAPSKGCQLNPKGEFTPFRNHLALFFPGPGIGWDS